MVMIPQLIMMRPIQTDGEKYFMAKLLGASKITYGTKNTATAMLYRFPLRPSSATMLFAGMSLLSVRAFPRFTCLLLIGSQDKWYWAPYAIKEVDKVRYTYEWQNAHIDFADDAPLHRLIVEVWDIDGASRQVLLLLTNLGLDFLLGLRHGVCRWLSGLRW